MPTEHGSTSAAGAGASPGQPTGWTGKRYPAWNVLSIVILVALTLAGLLGGASAFASADPVAGAVLLAAAVYVAHIAGLGLSARWTPRRTPRAATLAAPADGTTGVTFRYSAWAYYWLVAVLLLTTIGLAAIAALSAAAVTGAGIAMATVAGIFAVALAWLLVTVLRLAPGVVTLSPAGVYHRSLTFTHFVPWFAVFAVEAEWTGAPLIAVKAFPSDGTRLLRYAGRLDTKEAQLLPYLAVRARWLGTDPAVVYRTLAHYHAHPDQRAELGTAAAVGKINSAEFGGPPAR